MKSSKKNIEETQTLTEAKAMSFQYDNNALIEFMDALRASNAPPVSLSEAGAAFSFHQILRPQRSYPLWVNQKIIAQLELIKNKQTATLDYPFLRELMLPKYIKAKERNAWSMKNQYGLHYNTLAEKNLRDMATSALFDSPRENLPLGPLWLLLNPPGKVSEEPLSRARALLMLGRKRNQDGTFINPHNEERHSEAIINLLVNTMKSNQKSEEELRLYAFETLGNDTEFLEYLREKLKRVSRLNENDLTYIWFRLEQRFQEGKMDKKHLQYYRERLGEGVRHWHDIRGGGSDSISDEYRWLSTFI